MVRIGKDPFDCVVTIRGGILAYMYLYCAPHPNLSNHLSAILAYNSDGQCRLSWAFGGTHSRVAERTRLFPEGKYSGKCQAIMPI